MKQFPALKISAVWYGVEGVGGGGGGVCGDGTPVYPLEYPYGD